MVRMYRDFREHLALVSDVFVKRDSTFRSTVSTTRTHSADSMGGSRAERLLKQEDAMFIRKAVKTRLVVGIIAILLGSLPRQLGAIWNGPVTNDDNEFEPDMERELGRAACKYSAAYGDGDRNGNEDGVGDRDCDGDAWRGSLGVCVLMVVLMVVCSQMSL